MASLRSGALQPATRCLRSTLLHPHKRRRLSSLASTPSFRVLLFGADEFSCATLRALHDAREGLVEKLVVVTPPDARTGRGLKKVHRPPLRLLAEELDLETIALPQTLLKGWEPPSSFLTPSPSNLLLTASFGHLIPTSLLSRFSPLNTLNVHPSLLPLYRGAAPIQWAITNGEERTGVSVQELSRGKFDQGRLLGQKEVDIPPHSTFGSLEPLLAKEGGALLVEVLRNFEEVQAKARPQDSALATLAPKLTKDSARIAWLSKSAHELINMQRGFSHQVPLWTTLGGSSDVPTSSAASDIHLQIQLFDPTASTAPTITFSSAEAPGTVALDSRSRRLYVHCGSGAEVAIIDKIKAPSGKWVSGRDWWNGAGKSARGGGPTARFE
ncbi:formyl transferase [Leucosporidium creatinivorum]|uniref:methionyl-tRNA formyltransferase n=1 Tax=Leucosporidium creatinivorum TaxID=106004 RepID=A0A1Y2G5P4_9BASI|nr:formyl transferase [Leucosporidium creatinivorum]